MFLIEGFKALTMLLQLNIKNIFVIINNIVNFFKLIVKTIVDYFLFIKVLLDWCTISPECLFETFDKFFLLFELMIKLLKEHNFFSLLFHGAYNSPHLFL